MKSIAIENWFEENVELFPHLEVCKKYFENLEGEITEFSTHTNENTHRFDFTVKSSLSYRKPLSITITYNADWKKVESYSQKQLDTECVYNYSSPYYQANISFDDYYAGNY